MRTLLVTGGCGFIGSNFILHWLKNYPQDIIVNVDKLTYAANPKNLQEVEHSFHYKFFEIDICDRMKIQSLFEIIKPDTIVHFAAESHVDNSIKNSTPFIQTNVVGTHNLLQCAVEAKIKHFHHISTDEVFGSLDLNSKAKFTEQTVYDPRSPYSASKAASDHLVRSYYHTFGLPITISNCSNNYGPRQHVEKLIPLAITNLLKGKKVPLYGTGANIRDWIYVDDHVRGIEHVLNFGKAGETYLFGGDYSIEYNNRDIILNILSLLRKGEDQIEYVADRLGHDQKYAVDCTKARNELGWYAQTHLAIGLLKTVEWYEKYYCRGV